jgi:holliday junction DNA helicase RuvA
MIVSLKGILRETAAESAVVEANGLGYLIHASSRTLQALGAIGDDVQVRTELQVREDAWTLYGFASALERDAFKLLISVQGVGGRVALAILSILAPEQLGQAIAAQDKAAVARANGVGPKLAQRIVSELKDKAGALGGVALGASGGTGAVSNALTPAGIVQDALLALAALGFKPMEATSAVASAHEELGTEITLDNLVRSALKKLAR